MHIPSSMLHGAICPVTVSFAVAATAGTLYFIHQQEEKPLVTKFAGVTSLIFAMQMLNFPVQHGTSGHLLGGMLAVALLGTPFAVLSIGLVLAVQAFFFGDGGVNALGANFLNMGLIGSAGAGLLFNYFKKVGISQTVALAVASWLSVVLASLACTVEVSMSGAVEFSKVAPAMLSIHALIGIGEALITVAVVSLLSKTVQLWKVREQALTVRLFVLAIIAVVLSPFASRFPDGLQWVATRLSIREFQSQSISTLFQGYHVSFVTNPAYSSITAGIMGVLIVSFGVFLINKFYKLSLRQ